MEGKPLITRWKKSFYGQNLPINEEIPLNLVIESPAAPYIDYLQSLYIRSLTILLLIALGSILMAKFLSCLLVNPILNLAKFTTNLPKKLLRDEKIKLPRSSVTEMDILTNNFEVMSVTIEKNIRHIQQTNQQLKQAKEIAETANKAKEQFLANISHELKTPLSSIIGYSNLIQKKIQKKSTVPSPSSRSEKSQSDLTEWLAIIRKNGEYLLSLINEILDISKTNSLQIQLNPAVVHFATFMYDIEKVISEKAAGKNLTFTYEATGSLPAKIYADGKRLKQILFNLLDNAIKFTEQGGITLEVYQRDRVFPNDSSSSPQVSLRFAIIDTGIGIASQDIDVIFQPFERVSQSDSDYPGTGLGLAICRQLAELMGGKIEVHSQLNRGSIFLFDVTFPDINVSSEIESKSTGEIIGYRGRRRKLLVADDRSESLSLMRTILEPLDFEIITAENGQQALELTLQNKPDLIVADMFMPVKTGFILVAEIRAEENFKQMPIIATSASTFEEVKRQSYAMGCDAFLAKPIDDEKLLSSIGKHLNLEWIYRSN
jgi:signal transduction histidine kinase/CheY-like chemotaxis protein